MALNVVTTVNIPPITATVLLSSCNHVDDVCNLFTVSYTDSSVLIDGYVKNELECKDTMYKYVYEQ